MYHFFSKIVLGCFIFIVSVNIAYASDTSYFVDSVGGNDTNTGLSHAEAWKTINKVNNHSFNYGDNVYFKSGCTFSGASLDIDWQGGPGDKVIIGAYYYNGSQEIIGVSNEGKPVIDGQNIYPKNAYRGLVNIRQDMPHITIQDLNIKNSYGFGVWFEKQASNGTVQRCKVENTRKTNIKSSADYLVAMSNECGNGATERSGAYWPQGGISSSASHATIIGNYVYDQYGEGILVGDNSTVIGNTVKDTASKGIYIIGTENSEVANNLVFGTTETTYENPSFPGWHDAGIGVAIESGSRSNIDNVKIHHNRVINTAAGIRMFDNNSSYDMSNIHIYSNIFIDNRYTVHISNKGDVVDVASISFKDNISYTPHEDSRHSLIAASSLNNWECDSNYWSNDDSTPKDALSTDILTPIGVPFEKSTWRGYIVDRSSFSSRDLQPTFTTVVAKEDSQALEVPEAPKMLRIMAP